MKVPQRFISIVLSHISKFYQSMVSNNFQKETKFFKFYEIILNGSSEENN